MIDKMKAILKAMDMCVLATCADNKPHCSLMAYVPAESGELLYMATLRESQKFSNLQRNPAVSLLVDTRTSSAQDRRRIQSLTVTGRYVPVTEPAERDAIRKQLLARHAHLEILVNDPAAEIVRIDIEAFLLLDGPVDAHYVKLT
jgi:nitroimidazol reductase NimA-like FMN-containing flavoprotein (pyridoxamine 5'-phosphate oxidase superfamily)